MTRLLPAALFFAVPVATLAEVDDGPRVAVVPFGALTGDIPQKAGSKAAGMLLGEIKNTDSLQAVENKKNAFVDPRAEVLARARNYVEEAKGLRTKRKFRLAEEALTKALSEFRAAAPSVTDIAEVEDAMALLAAVQFNTGKDDEGQKNLSTAISLAPNRELPLAQTSALFSRLVAETRKAVQVSPKGSLQVDSIPLGAPVYVDGLLLGNTPLLVKGVPPGLHFWRVQLPSGENAGGTLDVSVSKPMRVSGVTAGNDPETRILSALSQNRLDETVVALAKEHAQASHADLVILGALSQDSKHLALDSFVLTAASGELRRLPRTTFDAELLSAGMEFYNLAGQLAKTKGKLGDPVKVPSTVAMSKLDTSPKPQEARYGSPVGKELTPMEPDAALEVKDEGPRAPLAPAKRKPLQRK